MDIARTPPTKTKRNLMIGGGIVALIVVTAWTLSLDPASQSIERSAVLIDSVRRGDMVREVRPHQCTLVPVRPGEVTSQAGWPPDTPVAEFETIVTDLQSRGIRVSLFIDAEPAAVTWAASLGAQRIELYTEPFAHAFKEGHEAAERSFRRYIEAANLAHALGLGINAGHDLDLKNLVLFRQLPYLDEVSIGHALISHALYVGLDRAVRDYLRA